MGIRRKEIAEWCIVGERWTGLVWRALGRLRGWLGGERKSP
jgi:hypothetical protein